MARHRMCSNYTLATEENVGNIPVCACWNHFPITCINEFYHNTQPNNFEYPRLKEEKQEKMSIELSSKVFVLISQEDMFWVIISYNRVFD